MTQIAEGKLDFVFGRRSVRIYAPGPISDETVTMLLQAAMAAPSAMTKDPWRFIVVREEQALAQMAAALPGGKMLATATVGIAVCGDLDAALERQVSYMLQDCSAAIENLLLAAHSLGLGACWVGVHPSEECIARLKEMLSLPPPLIPIAVIALGHPGENLEARTRYNPQFVRQGNWQAASGPRQCRHAPQSRRPVM